MQATRETSRQKRSVKRRNSRKKSLSPSDLKCSQGDSKSDSKLNGKRSLSEGSVKTRHKKGNIQRTLTYPISCTDFEDVSLNEANNLKGGPGPPESDESNIPPTSSDRDTEDDVKVTKTAPYRPRWDSSSEMDSLVSIAVKKAARRRRTPASLDWGANCETGEVSEAEAGRMRPEDYRLVFLSSDSSCREDTEDSASTASSAAPPVPDDCDWDYFEPGAPRAPSPPAPTPPRPPPACARACSCGAEPRIVAVPVPVPVPVPAALWPALLAFPAPPPTPHWNTYPGFPPLDAAALARLTTAAAVAVTAAATASVHNKLEMTIDGTDKAVRAVSQAPEVDNDKDDKIIERSVEHETSDEIKVIAEDSISVLSEAADAMPDHLDAENAFPSSNESAESSDSEGGVARRSYDLRSGAPDEPATTDEDSDDSGGGGGQFSRVFVVNPADSSSDMEDNADSSGIDCDDSFDKKSDSLEIIAAEIAVQNNINIEPESNQQVLHTNNDNILILETVNFSENYPIISLCNNSADSSESVSKNASIMTFCDENMLQSEICEKFNSFNTVTDDLENSLDYHSNTENNQSSGISENIECDSLDNSYSSDYNIKVSVSVDSECSYNTATATSNEMQTVQLRKLSPSPELKQNETSLQTLSSPTVEKIDLFKGIERTLSELLKKELMEDHGAEKIHNSRPVCSAEGSAGAPVAAPVCRPLSPDADARFTSRVMITHDRVSVVTSDTTRLMRDIIVHHTNSQNEPELAASEQDNENSELLSDAESPQPSDGVTVVSNADTLSAVVCLEEGLADDDSWVEDVSHDDDVTSPSDSDSGDEATLPTRGDFAYCRRSLDFTLHTIVEESCEESETEQTIKKTRPISATELEKYFFFGLGDGSNVRDDEEQVSETSSICSEGAESIVETEQTNRKSGDSDELVSSRLEKYFLSGFMGFNQERHHSDGSGSVGSDSEGKQSPEQRRKRLVRARGAPRSHSSSLDNLLAGDEPSQDTQEISDGSSTETEDRHESLERLDMPGEMKRKKQSKKSRGSPADERRQSVEFPEETRDDTRSVSEGEDGRLSPRVEFPPLGSELSESKKQTSRDSGFVGSCDDLLKNSDNSSDFVRSHESKSELEEIIEEARPELDERIDRPSSSRPPPSPLTRKDSFNNWSSDEETNLMMTKMRTFFKQMINTGNVRSSTPASTNSESSRPPKPPQLLYFESELTRLMKTVPGIRDEEVREIVEYLSSEDTWSDSYDSSDYAGSDLEGTSANRSALRKQISDSCREIIDEFDRGNSEAGSLERDAVGAYQRLAATLGRAGDGSPPLFGKVMRHIGGRLVALMHEVSAGAPPSTDEDSASEPGALARSRSHDILEAAASRGSVASDSERFSWRGSFESALLAADSRGTLGGEARRSPAGAELAAQRSHSRSCGAISGSEDRLWRGRRRASAPDAESEEEQRAGSLPRLPSITGAAVPAGPVKSARYRAPGFRTATRAASAPGLHAPRRRRPPPAPQPALSPASTPSLQENVDTISDTEEDNSRPMTLPKVREENREKFKVYSFLASELVKPKAIPFKQKVSKHCTIGKKIDEKVLEQITKDTENMDLQCEKNNTLDESFSENIKQIQENIVQATDTDIMAAFDDSNKILDIQHIEIPTSKDVINETISEDITHCTKLTETDIIASTSDTNKTIENNSDCQHELSNASKTMDLKLALTPTVVRSKELSSVTRPQFQKEIPFISSTPAIKILDSQKIIENENNLVLKRQSYTSSDLSIDIKSIDSPDSSFADNLKNLNVLQEVHCESSKTNPITKLPVLKQNINSRYSPLLKLKRSLSTDKTTVPHDRIDIIYKSLSETIPTVCRKNYKEISPKKVDLQTTGSGSLSKMLTKPLTPLSKKKTETKNISLQNRNKTKSSSIQISPISKERGLFMSKTSTVTSKILPTEASPTLRKNTQKKSITTSKSSPSKTHTIIPTEKITILKRKSSELSIDTKCNNSTDSSYCSETTEDMNLSQEVHRKYSKSDIGTKLPVLKQNMNSKYSPLHKLKMSINKDKIVCKKDDNKAIDTSLSEFKKLEHGKESEEAKLEIKDLSDNNDSLSQIQLVTSTPKNKEIDNKSSDASDEPYKLLLKNTKSLCSLSESIVESEIQNVSECEKVDKSELAVCAAIDNKTAEKEIVSDVPDDKKFSKSRSISIEELGEILRPSKIGRRTLSMDPRSLSFADDIYISEESPGHATLPRRSNSPLPNERDLDRERFPLNRSGLQTRSESMASVYSGAGEGVRGGVPVRGEVQFSLVYNYRLGALEVGVKRCRDLAPIDVKKNRSDPYVKVYLLPDKSKTGKRKTKVKKNTLNPVFEETLSFQSSLESLSTRALWLSAWHADMFGRNDFLGEVTLPLAGRVFDDPAPGWHALGERSERPEEASGSRGDLVVGLKFELEPRASTGTLHVLVKEARRLAPSRAGALADVFCKSYLLPERGRLHKQKTPVCRRTLAPAWRAALRYPRLPAAGLAQRALELTLWDRDRLASNEFLGAVRLSRGSGLHRGEPVSWMDSTGKEVSLWETMLQRPNFWVEGSLPLRPHLNN